MFCNVLFKMKNYVIVNYNFCVSTVNIILKYITKLILLLVLFFVYHSLDNHD